MTNTNYYSEEPKGSSSSLSYKNFARVDDHRPNPLLAGLMLGLADNIGHMESPDQYQSNKLDPETKQKQYEMFQKAKTIEDQYKKQVRPEALADLQNAFANARNTSSNKINNRQSDTNSNFVPSNRFMYDDGIEYKDEFRQEQLPLDFSNCYSTQEINNESFKDYKEYFTSHFKELNDTIKNIYNLLNEFLYPSNKLDDSYPKRDKIEFLTFDEDETDQLNE